MGVPLKPEESIARFEFAMREMWKLRKMRDIAAEIGIQTTALSQFLRERGVVGRSVQRDIRRVRNGKLPLDPAAYEDARMLVGAEEMKPVRKTIDTKPRPAQPRADDGVSLTDSQRVAVRARKGYPARHIAMQTGMPLWQVKKHLEFVPIAERKTPRKDA